MDNEKYLTRIITSVPTHCDQISMVVGVSIGEVIKNVNELMKKPNWAFKSAELTKDKMHAKHTEVIFTSALFADKLQVKLFIHPNTGNVTTIKFTRATEDKREVRIVV
jgi:hypothetical protein